VRTTGLDIGVHDSRAAARIFLYLRQDLVADGQRDLGQGRPDGLRQRRLMRGVGIAVQQADRDAAHLLAPEHVDAAATDGASSGVRRLPSGRIFSITSSRSRRSTSAVAWSSACRRAAASGDRGFPARRGNPAVVISATRAPLPSRMVVGSDGGGVQHLRHRFAGQQRLQPGGDAEAVISGRGRCFVGAQRRRRRRSPRGR